MSSQSCKKYATSSPGLPSVAHHTLQVPSNGGNADQSSAQTISLDHEMRCGRGLVLKLIQQLLL